MGVGVLIPKATRVLASKEGQAVRGVRTLGAAVRVLIGVRSRCCGAGSACFALQGAGQRGFLGDRGAVVLVWRCSQGAARGAVDISQVGSNAGVLRVPPFLEVDRERHFCETLQTPA